jgi:molybdopterin-guanine dinucleotide biosynthesis protein A
MATKIEALIAQQHALKKQIAEARKAAAKKRESEILKLIRRHGLAEMEIAQLDKHLQDIASTVKQRDPAQPEGVHAFN